MSIREWWAKPWAKNLVFFGILGTLFFTDIGTWITVKYTAWSLDEPSYIEAGKASESLYRFDIELTDIHGQQVRLADYEGNVVFLNLWASWCVPCLAEFQGLVELQQALPELEMIVMNVERDAEFVDFVKDTKYDLPFWRVISPLPGLLTPQAIPASYILDAQGQVIYQFIGAADWGDPMVVAQIQKLMP